MAGLKRQQELPFKEIGPKRIQAFCTALNAKLADRESNFGKEYLKLLVEEIRIEGKEARLRGKYATVADLVKKTAPGLPNGVPRAGIVWLPEKEEAGHWDESVSL